VSGDNTLSGTISAQSGGTYTTIQSTSGLLTLSNATSITSAAGSARGVVLTGAGNIAVNGAITLGSATTLTLDKQGSGTATLSGANTYNGATTVSAGTLALGSATTLQSATGAVTVNGGTLSSSVASTALGGSLTVSGGSLTANGASAGTIVLAANKNFSMTTGTFTYSLGDTITGSGTGTFGITGGTFDLTNSISNYGITYSIFSGFSSGSVSGLTFANYDTTNYIASLSNAGQLSFSAIPEPSTYAALAGVLALGAVIIRRRSRQA
jgi:autotransporter-associated beta strand protein